MLEHDLPRYVLARGIVGHGNCEVRMWLFHRRAPAREGIPLPTLMPLQPFQQGILAKEALYLLPSFLHHHSWKEDWGRRERFPIAGEGSPSPWGYSRRAESQITCKCGLLYAESFWKSKEIGWVLAYFFGCRRQMDKINEMKLIILSNIIFPFLIEISQWTSYTPASHK